MPSTHAYADRREGVVRQPLWRSPRWLAVVACSILLVMGVALIGLQQWKDRRALQAELQRIRNAGQPTSNRELEIWFHQHTHDEGTPAWREILQLAVGSTMTGSHLEQLPFVGQGELPGPPLMPGAWDQAPLVGQFLEEVRPLLDQIERTTAYPTPVWQPVQMRGFDTLLTELQNSRSVQRILRLEVEHALYQRDAQRALRGLGLLRHTADAFDWDLVIVSRLVALALRGVQYDAIDRSLAYNLWLPEQLEAVVEQIGEQPDYGRMWRQSLATERTMSLSLLAGDEAAEFREHSAGLHRLAVFPGMILDLLGTFREMEQLEVSDLGRLVLLTQDWENRHEASHSSIYFPTQIFNGLMMPSYSGMAAAMANTEDRRRMTLSACGPSSSSSKWAAGRPTCLNFRRLA